MRWCLWVAVSGWVVLGHLSSAASEPISRSCDIDDEVECIATCDGVHLDLRCDSASASCRSNCGGGDRDAVPERGMHMLVPPNAERADHGAVGSLLRDRREVWAAILEQLAAEGIVGDVVVRADLAAGGRDVEVREHDPDERPTAEAGDAVIVMSPITDIGSGQLQDLEVRDDDVFEDTLDNVLDEVELWRRSRGD